MTHYTQGIITILSLVNPVICGLLFSQAVSGKPRAAQINAATRVILAILAILWLTAIGGAYLLKAFGISLDAFQAAGGLVLASIMGSGFLAIMCFLVFALGIPSG